MKPVILPTRGRVSRARDLQLDCILCVIMIERYSQLDFSEIRDLWLAQDTPFGVYVHIPFCLHRCAFCAYPGVSIQDRVHDVQLYFNKYLPSLISKYSTILESKSDNIASWAFGGGTPSLFSVVTLRNIFEQLPNFKHHSAPKIFEIHSGIWSEALLDLLHEYGFTHITLCQQTFDEEILKHQNRLPISSVEQLETLAKLCRERGFFVAADLIGFGDAPQYHSILQNDIQLLCDRIHPDEMSISLLYQKHAQATLERLAQTVLDSAPITTNQYFIHQFRDQVPSLATLSNYLQQVPGVRLFSHTVSPQRYTAYCEAEASLILPRVFEDTGCNTLGIGAYQNEGQNHTKSRIGDLYYIEVNRTNTAPEFKLLRKGYAEELEFITQAIARAGAPPDKDFQISILSYFVIEKDQRDVLFFLKPRFSETTLQHRAHAERIHQVLEQERLLMLQRYYR